MIIDIGTGVDESVVMWKYNDKDKWRDADIDELIHLYESIVRCKDCKQLRDCSDHEWYEYVIEKGYIGWCWRTSKITDHNYVKEDDFCSYGEKK